MRSGFVFTAALLALAGHVRAAAPDPALYTRSVRPYFEKFCFDCHDSTTQKGGLNLDALKPSFATRAELSQWTTIFDRIERGEMPPPKKARPPEQIVKPAMQWIGLSVYDAEVRRHAALGRSAWKRLNRVEYQNTIRDLLLIDKDVQSMLPEDALASGFDNVDVALDVSAIHLEKYLEAADAALDAALVKGPKPESVTKRGSLLTEKGAVADAMGKNISRCRTPPCSSTNSIRRKFSARRVSANPASTKSASPPAPIAARPRCRSWSMRATFMAVADAPNCSGLRRAAR